MVVGGLSATEAGVLGIDRYGEGYLETATLFGGVDRAGPRGHFAQALGLTTGALPLACTLPCVLLCMFSPAFRGQGRSGTGRATWRRPPCLGGVDQAGPRGHLVQALGLTAGELRCMHCCATRCMRALAGGHLVQPLRLTRGARCPAHCPGYQTCPMCNAVRAPCTGPGPGLIMGALLAALDAACHGALSGPGLGSAVGALHAGQHRLGSGLISAAIARRHVRARRHGAGGHHLLLAPPGAPQALHPAACLIMP